MKSKIKLLAVSIFLLCSVNTYASTKDVVDTAKSAKKFTVLLKALDQVDLVQLMKSEGPFTVLAPTDEAFSKLESGVLDDLLLSVNKAKLASILKYHVIEGSVDAVSLANGRKFRTVEGSDLSFKIENGRLKTGNVNMVGTDITATNGVIHVIDQVLIPPKELSSEAKALDLIETAINYGVPLYNKGQTEACTAVYEVACVSLLGLGKGFLSKEVMLDLNASVSKAHKNNSFSKKAWILRGVLDRTYTSLQESTKITTKTDEVVSERSDFKVLLEADLPKGFPKPGPLNEVVLKDYPSYRAARVGGAGMQNFAFMKLFGHIKQNGISMTAPVEMTIDEKSTKRKDMAFLYGNKSIGNPGVTSNGVDVLDLPSKKYISIGLKGRESTSLIKSSLMKLEDWLSKNEMYEEAGSARLLGYNSPMVPQDKRFWEVQIPVKVKDGK
ncbi:MAG: heme-binding protein [Lentisphaeraceae bacterium]|nr:heme-binding protein [Lentisphaeraceae bacterium]